MTRLISLVSAHGGTIDAASTPGAGTTFTVVLPLDAAGMNGKPTAS